MRCLCTPCPELSKLWVQYHNPQNSDAQTFCSSQLVYKIVNITNKMFHSHFTRAELKFVTITMLLWRNIHCVWRCVTPLARTGLYSTNCRVRLWFVVGSSDSQPVGTHTLTNCRCVSSITFVCVFFACVSILRNLPWLCECNHFSQYWVNVVTDFLANSRLSHVFVAFEFSEK